MTILLVDDDEDEIFLFEEALREIAMNIKLVTSDGSGSCFDIVKNSIPDFIFLDVNMPRVSGKDCLKTIKSNDTLAHIPIIMYSTSISPTDEEFFRESGADYIKKPSSFQELVNFIKQLVLNEELEG